MKKQIRRRKAIALVLCLFMMLSITPLSYADEMVADAPAADITDSGYESVDVTDVDNSVDNIVSDIFENETPAGDVEGIVEDGTEADATVETPADSEGPAPQEPQYDENGNLIVPEEGAEEPVEEVTEGDVPGAICTNPDCQCPCHQQQEVKECTCGAAEGEAHQPGCPLYVEVSEEILELYEKLMACESQEDVDAFVKGLTEEQLNALCEYMLKLQEQKPPYIPETVSVTEAGPFMPPVTVETSMPKRMMKAARGIMAAPMTLLALGEPTPQAESGHRDVDGLVTSKVVNRNDDGSFKITLEAYTTGTVTTEESTIPVDIVLVLDQSGSMAYDFGTTTRQAAMKSAVNTFIDGVAAKSDSANHRLAIVTYTTKTTRNTQGKYDPIITTAVDWTNVKEKKASIKDVVTSLPDEPTGGTPTGDAMVRANELITESNKLTGTRQKVVILFTDGVPGTSGFDTSEANKAITAAAALKNNGATVYSVGIFTGANPLQLNGDKWDYSSAGLLGDLDVPCSGEVGSMWGMSRRAASDADVDPVDIAAGNRFLNYISTNYKNAQEIGIEKVTGIKPKISDADYNKLDWWGKRGYDAAYLLASTGDGWLITENNERTADEDKNYYLTAKDAGDLNKIFQTISEQISTPDFILGTDAVVKDTVTPYFKMPTNVNDITVETVEFNGSAFDDENPKSITSVTTEIDPITNTISVTDFDFNANNVSKTEKTAGDYGRKLKITFDVTPKDEFLGGNNVPTNGDDSGVYAPMVGSEQLEGLIEQFEVPHVNVPIKDVTVTAQEKNVYLLGTLDQDQLMSGVTVKCGNVNLLDEIDPDMSAFVNITLPSAADITTGLTGDRDYTVTATVSPVTTGSSSLPGTVATEQTDTDTAKINVFKPEVTYADTNVWYGADAPDYAALDDCRNTTVAWKHLNADGTKTDATNVTTMIGDVPTLSYSYALPSAAVADGDIATKKDIPVQATVKIGTTNVNEYTTFQHTPCTDGETAPTDGHFLLHNHTCSLTLTKNGGNTGESYIFNISKGGNHYMTVSVSANNSITIYELPVGHYNAVEDETWSWRFNPASGNVILSASQDSGTIICNNSNGRTKWLNGYAAVVTNTSSATSHASAGVLPMGDNPIRYDNTPVAAAAVALDAILNTNMEEGELDA